MTGARRPLPPLDGRQRTKLLVVAGLQGLIGVTWMVLAVAQSGWFKAVVGVGFLAIAGGGIYEVRRRSDPARTAGWGRQRCDGETDAQRRLDRWQRDAAPQQAPGNVEDADT